MHFLSRMRTKRTGKQFMNGSISSSVAYSDSFSKGEANRRHIFRAHLPSAAVYDFQNSLDFFTSRSYNINEARRYAPGNGIAACLFYAQALTIKAKYDIII